MKAKKILILAAVALFVVVVLNIKFYFDSKKVTGKVEGAKFTTETKAADPAPEIFTNLAGEKTQTLNRPVAVMIDNQVKARPQSGLLEADLVYEALAEGGITRFMAVYEGTEAKNIGPVRSARTYFAEMADELGALYAHVGGNSDVLQYIKQNRYMNMENADQFFDDVYFHRIKTRNAPHNVYTSVSNLRTLLSVKKVNDEAKYKPWKFKDGKVSGSLPDANKLVIKFGVNQFSEADYYVSWNYSSGANAYLRTMGGQPHKDADTGKQITAKNIVVQFADVSDVVSDTLYSINYKISGDPASSCCGTNLAENKAVIFMDGKVITGKWVHKNGDRTRYYDGNGEEIFFNPGQTWIEVVPGQNPNELSWQ